MRIRKVADLQRTLKGKEIAELIDGEMPLWCNVHVDGYNVSWRDNEPRLDLIKLQVHSVAILTDGDSREVVLLVRRPDIADDELWSGDLPEKLT